MATAKRFAAFLPDWGCVLKASLAFVDADMDHDRALYPCVRPECACSGVFYKAYGGAGSRLRLTVWLESAPTPSNTPLSPLDPSASPASSRLAAAVDPATAADLVDFFSGRAPDVSLHYGSAATPPEVVSSDANRKWIPDAARLGGGAWEVTFRPSHITGDTALAQAKVTVGMNETWTKPFEVRTKPAEWVLLQDLPAAWGTEAAVRGFLAACIADAPKAVVIRRDATTHGVRLVAFAKYQNRAKACGALVGFKTLLRRQAGKGKAKTKTKARMPTAVAPPAGFEAVTVSLVASLNRLYADDKALLRAVVSASSIPVSTQTQPRPACLAQPSKKRTQAGAGVAPATASSKRIRVGTSGGEEPVFVPALPAEDASPVVAAAPLLASPELAALPAPVLDDLDLSDCSCDEYDSDSDSDVEEDVVPVLPVALDVPQAPFFSLPTPAACPPSPLAALAACPPVSDMPSPVAGLALSPFGNDDLFATSALPDDWESDPLLSALLSA